MELSPDIIVAYSTPPVVALHQGTRSIPIVFLTVTDPLSQGLVASLAHPGGNITGFSTFEISTGTKWMRHSQTDIAQPPTGRHHLQSKDCTLLPTVPARDRESRVGIRCGADVDEVHDDAEIERAISTLAREPGGGLIVMPDTFNMVHRQTIITLAARYPCRQFTISDILRRTEVDFLRS